VLAPMQTMSVGRQGFGGAAGVSGGTGTGGLGSVMARVCGEGEAGEEEGVEERFHGAVHRVG
jgi:hypothetical protein